MWLRALAAARRRRTRQVVSLGRACQPAHQIRRILGITAAQVFDWIITTDQGLVALIEANLDGFFTPDRLVRDPKVGMVDLPTGTKFLHEFPKGSDVSAQHAEHAGRYAMLVRRWCTLLASDEHVLFVRQHGWDPESRAAAVRLRQAIRRQAPRLPFTILYLTSDPIDEVSWHEEGIINRYLPQPKPYHWKGDDAAWERLLGEALAQTDRA